MKNVDMKVFKGEQCETTAVGTLLLNMGIDLSEPMLFGLGESLSYGAMKFGGAKFPFIGGRIRTGYIIKNICNNLGLKLDIRKTRSIKKAWSNVKTPLDLGRPVGLQLDCYYLEYFSSKMHFAGHFATLVDYDDDYAYLVDTVQQGSLMKTSLSSLAEARSSRQPMSENNLSFTIDFDGPMNSLEDILRTAMKRNAHEFLNPPIKSFGYKGILKTSEQLMKWFRVSKDVKKDFSTTAMLMERAGTGGALFRNFYRDFLKEAYDLLNEQVLLDAHDLFEETAVMWTDIADLFNQVAESKDKKYIIKVSEILKVIAQKEYDAMKMIVSL